MSIFIYIIVDGDILSQIVISSAHCALLGQRKLALMAYTNVHTGTNYIDQWPLSWCSQC